MYHYLLKEVKAECYYLCTLSFNCFEKLNSHSAILINIRVLDHRRNNESLMLIYNLAVMKNSKMKVYTEDKSREKQKSSVKITLTVSDLALKGNINELNFKRD